MTVRIRRQRGTIKPYRMLRPALMPDFACVSEQQPAKPVGRRVDLPSASGSQDLNPVEVAEAVRSGGLEAGLVVLPIPAGLDVRPLLRDEVVWVSLDLHRTTGAVTLVTMEQVAAAPLAPLRRALRVERPDSAPAGGPSPGGRSPPRTGDRGRERRCRGRARRPRRRRLARGDGAPQLPA